MRFMTLFKKELKEMLNLQNILIMVIMVVVLSMAGQGMSQAMEEGTEAMMEVNLCDLDDTDFSRNVVKFMTANLAKEEGSVNSVTLESDDYAKELKRLGVKNVLIIPKGFTDSVNNNETAEVRFVQKMTSLSAMGNQSTGSQIAVQYLSVAVKDVVYNVKQASGKLSQAEISFLDKPLKVSETTIVGSKSDNISSTLVLQMCSAQGMLVPMLMYILIIMSTNMMVNAVSTEKIDKTLETLLSSPISRLSVITAKMLAAAVVAAAQAAAYMFGMHNMMDSMLSSGGDGEYSQVLENLGLTLNAGQYILIGLQMFISILIVLSISLVLGILAQDVKSAQTLTMPVMAGAMVPFMLSMFLDINSLSPVLRYVVYAIPFTHSFCSSANVMFGNNTVFYGGLIYQVIFLIACLAFALRIFMSDRIFTMSLGVKKTKDKTPAE
ncbi:MAG: ABC transporter permease [Ruminococcus sp.]|nr:ABC transporter permease [Ruminococcus sp.]